MTLAEFADWALLIGFWCGVLVVILRLSGKVEGQFLLPTWIVAILTIGLVPVVYPNFYEHIKLAATILVYGSSSC
jgi:hypothetical protein